MANLHISLLAVAILAGLSHVHAISSLGEAMRRTSSRQAVEKQGSNNPFTEGEKEKDFTPLYIKQVRASTEQSKINSPMDPNMLNGVAKDAKQEAAAELKAYITAEAAGRARGAVPIVDLIKTSEELTDASHKVQEIIANKTVDVVQSAVVGQKLINRAEALGGKLFSNLSDVFDKSVQPQVDAASVNVAMSEYESLNAEAHAAEAKAQVLLMEAMNAREAANQAAKDYEALRVAAEWAVEQARHQQEDSTEQLHDVAHNAVKDVQASTKHVMDVIGTKILDVSGNQIENQ